jgi:ABC-type polysaccharide/polyol phosphate export permease
VLAEVYAFAISIVILLGLAAAFQVWPGWHTLWLAPAAALLVLLTVGAATVLSALQVYFRDVRYVVQASLLAWFYLTPVFYPLEFLREHRVPAALRVVVQVNPATGVVELFRAAVTGADRGWGVEALITTAWAVALLALATWLHRRWDRLFADLL